MLNGICVVICFLASAAGAICGIGGGIIIKPVLDALRIMDISAINFMSGCTVLSMSAYSVIRSKVSGDTHIEQKTGFPLAVGAAAGGLIGKAMFAAVLQHFGDKAQAGRVQAAILLILTAGTLVYTLCKERIRTFHVTGVCTCILIGVFLGILSSFLGIGGGPVNLVILFFFFSMSTKAAAENSLYIILFSQITSLTVSVFTGNAAHIDGILLFLMSAGGICGGICGRAWNKKISDKTVDRLFIVLMVVIIGICIYNVS